MNSIKYLFLLIICVNTNLIFAKGGDDVGNGGFAYKQSVIILKMAATSLSDKIRISTLKDITDFPERRSILENTLGYDDLEKISKKNQYRRGRKLAMNYTINPPTVYILKSYFEAFAGKTDTELEDASLEVQKRLLHEASHIWGYNENESEEFAIAFLKNIREGEKIPTDKIQIKPSFFSCLNGFSDLYNNCDEFCKDKPITNTPILYLDTIIGEEIANKLLLKNLYDWCNEQTFIDQMIPQCFLRATDGISIIDNIPVLITKNSNSLTANIQSLSLNKTYSIKLIKINSKTETQSQEFQLKRRSKVSSHPEIIKTSTINQYTCIEYTGKTETNGNTTRTGFARLFYYFANNEIPTPIPPSSNGPQSIVCHDEQRYPGNDYVEYPRQELISHYFMAWDKFDNNFERDQRNQGKLKINSLIEERLSNEFGIKTNLDLFHLVSNPNLPLTNPSLNTPLAYIMLPFSDEDGQSFCPSLTKNKNLDPLSQIISQYINETEGLYIAEMEAQVLKAGDMQKIVYGSMFITETDLKNYGFYIIDGHKVRAQENDFDVQTLFYYWPINEMQDPLIKGDRKIFTVKYPDQLQTSLMGIPNKIRTSDKRIGCIPKQKNSFN